MGSNFAIVHLLLTCFVVGFAAAQESTYSINCRSVQTSEFFNITCTVLRDTVDVTDNVTFTCSIDGEMEEPCPDPISFDSTTLGVGRHTINITATVDGVILSVQFIKVDCGNLDAPENGFIDVSGTNEGSIAEYSCQSGYVLTGDRERVCQSDGQWSGVARTCLIDCGTLMNPENGQVNFTDTTFGANATYTCDEGFSLEGVDTRTCMANGQWSDSEPTCVFVDCGTLMNPENGQVNFMNTTFGADATYTCDEGFSLEGVDTRTCMANGQWSDSEPTCVFVDCGTLMNPENGQVSFTDTTFGAGATYTCDEGFSLEGVDTRMCMADGEWSDSEPTCVIVDCGTLMNPENGTVDFTDTMFGANATYTCDEGFSLEGVDTRTCMADGEWSDSEPTCGTEAAQFSLLVVTLLVIVGLTIVWV